MPPPLHSYVKAPRGNLSRGFDAVCARLRKPGTALPRHVKTWQLADGSENALTDPEDWTTALFPLVRLDPSKATAAWRSEGQSKARVPFAVTIAVPSADVRDLVDLWEVFVDQMYPGDKSLFTELKKLGVPAYGVGEMATQQTEYADGLASVGQGSIWLTYEFPTLY